VKNFSTPFRGVPAQLKYRLAFGNFHAKLAVSGGGRLDVGKGKVQAHRAVFAAEDELGSLQQGFAAALPLAKPHNAIRFVAHEMPTSKGKFSNGLM
jgi:hypothetical protein